MRSAFLTLIGFAVFTLCPSMCPMSANLMPDSHAGHAAHHEHMAHHDMPHEEDKSHCDHCEVSAEIDLALNGTDPIADAPALFVSIIAISANSTNNYIDSGVPKSHLANAGPPVVPDIVRTIVLRT